MKKLIVFLLFSISVLSKVFASPANSTIHKVIQPNGDTISISLHGDEYGSWYENSRGNVIDRNKDKYWVYVNAKNFLYGHKVFL